MYQDGIRKIEYCSSHSDPYSSRDEDGRDFLVDFIDFHFAVRAKESMLKKIGPKYAGRELDVDYYYELIYSTKLVVRGIGEKANEQQLRNLFEPYGKVLRFKINSNHAYVEFESCIDAALAKDDLNYSVFQELALQLVLNQTIFILKIKMFGDKEISVKQIAATGDRARRRAEPTSEEDDFDREDGDFDENMKRKSGSSNLAKSDLEEKMQVPKFKLEPRAVSPEKSLFPDSKRKAQEHLPAPAPAPAPTTSTPVYVGYCINRRPLQTISNRAYSRRSIGLSISAAAAEMAPASFKRHSPIQEENEGAKKRRN